MATERVRAAWILRAFLCGLGSIALLGCGGGNRKPVSGAITLDGQPLNGVIVEFAPDAAKGNTASLSGSGAVTKGRYELRTVAVTRAESGSGIPPGWYKVTVTLAPIVIGRKNKPEKRADIPARYTRVDKTPLEIEVKDNPEPGAYDIKLTK